MKALLATILLSIFSQINAQDGKLYKGTINGKIKITLYLSGLDAGTYADAIAGSYKYDSKNNYILLNGYRNNKGNFSLVELSTANFTGIFLGNLIKNKIVGNWISADQKRNYPVDLIQVSATKAQLTIFQKAIEDKGTEFNNY